MGEVQDIKDVKKIFIAPAIKSFDHYDFARAKIGCSLKWLVTKAYGTDGVPADLRDPFYTDQYDQEHLKPPVVSLLLSADLYRRAGSHILKSDPAVGPLLGHDAVIQALAQRGLYVTDQERLVTERDLHRRPLQMSAHLAMIDALMMAVAMETVSTEKVLACVRQYYPCNADLETPYDTEDAVTTWINKVCVCVCTTSGCLYCTHSPVHVTPVHALIGSSPDAMDPCPHPDVSLKENMTLADSLYNLQLIRDFCRDHLDGCCHFTLEDMLYASSTIKSNYLAFMAELFTSFEVDKPSFVKPRILDVTPSSLLKNIPAVPISKATKRSFMDRSPSPERPSLPLRPQPRNTGEIRRSTSMSFVDGNVGTWPKEKRSGPYGVSFDIPFDKNDPAPASETPPRGMVRSASTDDGAGFKVHHMPRGMKRNLSFQPVHGQNLGIEEEGCPESLAAPEAEVRPTTGRAYPNGHGNAASLPSGGGPSMEDALRMISPSRPATEGTNSGFFLHGPAGLGAPLDPVSESDFKGPPSSSDDTGMDTGVQVRTEDALDEDSSLRDCSVNLELELDTPSPSGSAGYGRSPSAAVRMTSFAEQKQKKLQPSAPDSGRGSSSSLKTTPEGSELGLPLSVTWAPSPKHSPVRKHSPPPPLAAMATEMVELRMRLEEKRKAIEAQKKKVEAAFTRHRQRTGRSAFLDVVKRRGDGAAEEGGKAEDGGKAEGPSPALRPTEVDLTEYTRSIDKLNHSLGFLQTEMQRLAQQQEVIMAMREQKHQQSWLIPAPHANPAGQNPGRVGGAGTRSSGPSSPVDSPRVAHRSPTSIRRKSASFHSRSPRTPRPSELKLAPYNRVLTAPQSVDSIPRLRRFSPCQPLAHSFVYMGENPARANPETDPQDGDGNEEDPLLSLESEGPHSTTSSAKVARKLGNVKQWEVYANMEVSGMPAWDQETDADLKPTVDTSVSEVLSHPVLESFTVTPTESPPQLGLAKGSLVEVPLLTETEGEALEERDDGGAGLDADQTACRGFFFKEESKGEDNMAQKRAALLEKRMRREKESQMKKVQQEADLEQKKEEARLKAEEERLRKEEDKARKEFIKQEHLRRKQLKLMEDMDQVIKPRPSSLGRQRRSRPKSIHRESHDSPRTPVRAAGSRQRLFSVSSLSLASLSLGDADSSQPDKRGPRPDSADGFLSPSRSNSRNGEKDWENASTTSSVTSFTEYTGPKLYKEPSSKSNKHIIQNALAHCCLAGKVNEGQKNKILEQMEKCEANSFLVLFRDAGCQFRSLYTYCPETDDITKLTGIGPKSINRKMIEGLFKYNSDKKQFSQIPAKTMSASVDALTIHGHLWQTKKPPTPKKVVPPAKS
uniref:Calmodulin regulated spectrin-associated protein family, member 2a n=1 Tax=Gadus morhua TaxID=8049 RepID=A0A8C5F3J7_GADMO